jgi:uncharacterized protein YjaG (DUF416 family)
MGILRFDEALLKRELSRIPVSLRVVFAATVAERLLPIYAIFSRKTGRGDPQSLMEILERLWRDIDGIKMSPEELQQNIDLSMELAPDEDEKPWVPEQNWAEDAAAAVVYALCTRQNGNPQDAAWAARRAWEALDDFVLTQEDIDPNIPGAQERITSNPLIQAEFMRQQRDLIELVAADRKNVSAIAQKMRQRAKAESNSVFAWGRS